MKKLVTPSEISASYEKIKGDIYKTPLEYSSKLSEISGANVYLKMEHLQYTGSFKIRGVINKIKSLGEADLNKTFVAASTGNHAAAFAYASELYGFNGIIFLPKKVSKAKVSALQKYPIRKNFFGKNSMETEAKATDYAKEIGGILIHPYNDPEIIKGQGTIAIEIQDDLPEVDVVMAPVGGGGIISGICSYFSDTDVKVIGCQPENADEMYQSVEKGEIVPPSELHTISDATAGGIEDDSLTYHTCKKYLNGFELVSEESIKEAVAFVANYHHSLIEPGAALSVAAMLKSEAYKGKNVVLVLTGKKIDRRLLAKILADYGNNY